MRKLSLLTAAVLVLASVASPAHAESPPSQSAVASRAAPCVPSTITLRAPAADDLRVSTIKAAPFSYERYAPIVALPFLMAGLVGVRTIASDKDSPFTTQSVRAQYNALVSSFNYLLMNGLISSTIATQPACARATTASKVKTTNATVLKESGVAVALAGSDNFWTLTGANLAAGFFRRYLLLDTAGVASVLSSSDALTKALCAWPNLPADGTSIVGIITIQNVTNPFIPATTLLSAAGVTDTYIDGIDDSVFLHAQVTP